MALEEFHAVVVGNEPAGLWLLERLAQVAPELEREGKLAWVQFDEPLSPVAVPVRLAKPFSLSLSPSWSAEIITPSRSVSWQAEGLAELFPELPPHFADPKSLLPEPRLTSAQTSAVRYAIRNHPEVLTYASALWKFLGRTQNLNPETLVAAALSCAELAWWLPEQKVPLGVRRFVVRPRENGIEEIRSLKNGLSSIHFHDTEAIIGRHWILNCPWHRVLALSRRSPDLLSVLNVADDLRSPLSLAALRLVVEPAAIPVSASPLSICIATDDIPDPAREVWPIEIRNLEDGAKELSLWASVPRELPLEVALESFRRGLGEVSRLFPFLMTSVRVQSVPLGMDTCFSDEFRSNALSTLESTLLESHEYTALQTQTRLTGLHTLFPSLHCNLPSPIGPLYAAERILPEIVGKKRLQAGRSAEIVADTPP